MKEQNYKLKKPQVEFNILTLFPELFPGSTGVSVVGKALNNGLWKLNTINIREFSEDKHFTVDDSPFGGGPGLIMRPDILGKALNQVNKGISSNMNHRILCLSPKGKRFHQKTAKDLLNADVVTMICGRYEGIDERFISSRGIEELSIGDFIVSGGEQAALVIIDSVVRLLPGVLGKELSLEEESFERNLLEYPQYTRPKVWEGKEVPPILLSGNHQEIKNWRLKKSEHLTKSRRPDLWEEYIAQKKV
tara:strand:+ start:247 stop:990 length:744 start_codon:yes stop_codon:yes gene_type:complete